MKRGKATTAEVREELDGLRRRSADPPLAGDTEILLFRVVRELLFNIVKHARASAVGMAVSRAGGEIRVAVEDDGVGFEAGALRQGPTPAGGIGLFSARERLALLGGRRPGDVRRGAGPRRPADSGACSLLSELLALRSRAGRNTGHGRSRTRMGATFTAKATENVQAAEVLFEHGLYNASANRAYYAALQAAVAALTRNGIQLDRIDHDKVQARFSGELTHRRKVYPSRLRSYLMNLQAVRNDADYRSKSVSKKVAKRQLNKAKEYVEILRGES